MNKIFHLIGIYLRRAFEPGGGILLPGLMSLLTSFMLLFAVHTALPDTQSHDSRTQSHLLLFRFPDPITSGALSGF